jgi:hypothetical protein
MTDYVRRPIDRCRDLLRGHPSEIEHLDDLGQCVILGVECLEGSM